MIGRNSIREIFLAGVVTLSFSYSHGSPHVVGYERFHAEEPTREGGAILFSELGCANCHGGAPVVVPRTGPSLNDLSDRVDYEWVLEFLKNPETGRKGSTMPGMLHGLSEKDIDAVAAYLGTVGKGLKLKPSRHANAERGSALYHEKGCVACHAPSSDFRGPEGSGAALASELAISHPDLKKKTSITALDYFLSNPSRYRTDGRMPHLPLDKQESLDIAAHLIDFQASDPRESDPVKAWPKSEASAVGAGKALVEKMNCGACHSLPGIKVAAPLSLLGLPDGKTGGCLSEEQAKGIPSYDLTKGQRDSLLLYLGGDRRIKDTNGHTTLAAMNCYACHDRDGVGGPTDETDPFFVGDESLADSGRLPPPLTGIGHKLKKEWLEGVLAGKQENRVRPYLKTRMPGYAKHAAAMANWFSEMDQAPEAKAIVVHPEDMESGRKLLGIEGGVNCITCHNWGERRSLGIPSLDLSSLDQRIQSSWFREYLLNPAAYRPGTLMPPLWPGGASTVPDVLGGDAERQIAAIWGFIEKGEGVPEGFPDRNSSQFELTPVDRPIIQRTFLERTGSKAILVGFPGEIHIAYDGAAARPSLVWLGQFFNAYNTWFTRAAPFENPLSDDIYEFETSSEARRFLGYRTDAKGNPTFLSSSGGQKIEESFRVEENSLVRTIVWDQGGAPVVTHPIGVEVEEESTATTLTYTYSWK